jgi:hypothetical protein
MNRLLLLTFFITTNLFAQNIQLHYEYKSDKKYFLTRFEMFKPDEYGSNYLFIDMEYNNGVNKSVSMAYWEISRYISIPFISKNLSITAQYNDGIYLGEKLGPIWLFGLSHPLDLGFTSVSVDFLYRTAFNSKSPDAQITFFWDFDILKDKLKCNGFFDFWSEDDPLKKTEDKKRIVTFGQPQLWIIINTHVSIGTQIEISRNFITGKTDFQYNPTAAIRWMF